MLTLLWGIYMNDIIDIGPNDIRVLDEREYNVVEYFLSDLPALAGPLCFDVTKTIGDIESMLYESPALVNLVKAMIPDETLIAVITDENKQKFAKGAIELMTKKNGALMAKFRDPETKKIIETIDLQRADLSPELSQAMTSFSSQMQMAQILEEIHKVEEIVESVEVGLESDRLATADSLKNNYLLAAEITDPNLRREALLRIAMDAESSRALLMRSQTNNIKSIASQPESLLGRIVHTPDTKRNDEKINSLRDSMSALNTVSIAEALAYQSLGETNAAVKSLQFYGKYMQNTYGDMKLLNRLDGLDPIEIDYWSTSLPVIKDKILELPNTNAFAIGIEKNKQLEEK